MQTPGPGSYEIESKLLRMRPFYTNSTSLRFEEAYSNKEKRNWPGPGYYELSEQRTVRTLNCFKDSSKFFSTDRREGTQSSILDMLRTNTANHNKRNNAVDYFSTNAIDSRNFKQTQRPNTCYGNKRYLW